MVGGRNCDEVGAEHFRHLVGEQRRDRFGVLRARRRDESAATAPAHARSARRAAPALCGYAGARRRRARRAPPQPRGRRGAARSRVRSARDGAEVRSHAGEACRPLMIGRRRRQGYTRCVVSRVLLASPRGYCAGVERAVETVERALELYGPPVYVRKQIVHNAHVVRELEARGADLRRRGDGGSGRADGRPVRPRRRSVGHTNAAGGRCRRSTPPARS